MSRVFDTVAYGLRAKHAITINGQHNLQHAARELIRLLDAENSESSAFTVSRLPSVSETELETEVNKLHDSRTTQISVDWIRYVWLAIILTLMCAGGFKFLSNDAPSLTFFIPTAVAFSGWGFHAVMMHIVSIIPNLDIGTWLSILLVLVSLLMLYFAFREQDPVRRTIMFGAASTFFGWASGIHIGQATAKLATRRTTNK
jgi:hypothetical protein